MHKAPTEHPIRHPRPPPTPALPPAAPSNLTRDEVRRIVLALIG
jgi:hypothetical protein